VAFPYESALSRAVLDSTDDAVIAIDAHGAVVVWNPGAERLYGFSSIDIIGQPLTRLAPAGHADEIQQLVQRALRGEDLRDVETVRVTRAGVRVSVVANVAPIRDAAGATVGALSIDREQGSRFHVERSARRLLAIIESSDDAIVSKDLNGIVTSWNRAAERMFGYAAEEMIGESIRNIIPADRQREEDDVLARIRRGDRVSHFETMRRRKDGTLVPISLTVSPIRDRDGRVIGASKIARDVSDRLRFEAITREQTATTKRLAEVGAALASTLDRDVIVQKVTDAATELTGSEFGAFFYNTHDPESGETELRYTLSGTANDAFDDFPKPRMTALFEPTLRGDVIVRLDDVTMDARYGRNPPFRGQPPGHLPVRSYLAVPVKTGKGDVLGGLFFGHSRVGVFTERHEQVVGGIAAWASVALQNSQLYVEARDANRMKDEFLAVLSHELRTPLNAIVGYARLLRGGILSGDKAARGLETLERNANALTRIVEDVLEVSRIITGKVRLDVQPVELPLILHNAVATVQPAADAKGVRLQTLVDRRVGPVSGDPDRLQQVVWNLLSNAVKFTPRGGRVQIRLERADPYVDIVVSDTGIGIKPAFLPYVFERFHQAEAGTTRKTGGLGLGLAIVRHMVELHGGTVEASSPGDGQGAIFSVRLPVMAVHGEEFRTPGKHPEVERLEPLTGLESLQGIRIVAVDDEPDALMLLRVVLEAAGADVVTVSSPVNAVEQIRDAHPHAVVIDIGMPEMDGFELINRIRASPDEHVREVHAVALTAFARSDDRTRALRSGFELHLSKPVDPAELVASISTLVRRSRTPTQPR
jgi:PAS domain S-box-containing protein